MNARTTRTFAAGLSLTAALAISGCSSDSGSGSAAKAGADKPQMTVTGAFMPEPVNDKMAGAFMVIKNDSKTADKLTAVTSPLSDDLQIHETKDQKMQQVAAMDVAGQRRAEAGARRQPRHVHGAEEHAEGR